VHTHAGDVDGRARIHECCAFGCLHVHRHSNLGNSVRRYDGRMPRSAQFVLVLQMGLGSHCPVTMCIVACELLGLPLFRIAVYPRSSHLLVWDLFLRAYFSWCMRPFDTSCPDSLYLLCFLLLHPMP